MQVVHLGVNRYVKDSKTLNVARHYGQNKFTNHVPHFLSLTSCFDFLLNVVFPVAASGSEGTTKTLLLSLALGLMAAGGLH